MIWKSKKKSLQGKNNRIINSVYDFSNAELEFLMRINKYPVKSSVDDYWYDKIKDLNSFIKLCISKGYVNNKDIKSSLEKLTVLELKELLKLNNLSKSGKKIDIINRIKENIPSSKIKEYSGFQMFYSVSDEVENRIGEYIQQKQRNFTDMFLDMVNFTKIGQIDNAVKRCLDYENNLVFLPRYSTGEINKCSISKRQIQEFNMAFLHLEYSDVENTEAYKKVLRAIVVACMITSADSMRKNFAVECIRSITDEKFNCPELKYFLENSYCYLYKYLGNTRKDIDTEELMLKIYIHTKMFEASNKYVLYEAKNSKDSHIDGIQVLAPNTPEDKCKICKYDKKVYKLKELNKLPKLPAHYGCRCLYLIKYKF